MSSSMLGLPKEERELVFWLASQLTGACQQGNHRREVLVTNVLRRIRARGSNSLADYLALTERDPREYDHLISALTIHTTHWFRELPHFADVEQFACNYNPPGRRIQVWSAGCSTGEEAYSFALLLEIIRRDNPAKDYDIYGSDLDPVSIAKAKRAIYPASSLAEIAPRYHSLLSKGQGRADGFFTLSKSIRSRCHFACDNLLLADEAKQASFDLVICRNVLIYFSSEDVERVIDNLSQSLRPGGRLLTGHAEHFAARPNALKTLRASNYERLADVELPSSSRPTPAASAAATPAVATSISTRTSATTQKLSGMTTAPTAVAPAKSSRRMVTTGNYRPDCILIGASTGGPEALVELLQAMPANCPPLLVVQHMQVGFLAGFAQRLAKTAQLELASTVDGATLLRPATLYMPLSDHHLALRGSAGKWLVDRVVDAPVNRHRPSVDVLFRSAARCRASCCALLLTGMGTDGADGLAELHALGNPTAAQDEASSTVYGMPRAAIMRGAADHIGNLRELRRWLDALIALPSPEIKVAS